MPVLNIASSENVMSSTETLYLLPYSGKQLTPAVIKDSIEFITSKFPETEPKVTRDKVEFHLEEGFTDSAIGLKGINEDFFKKHPRCKDIASFHN